VLVAGTVLVAGATGGLGAATVRALSAAGHPLVLTYRTAGTGPAATGLPATADVRWVECDVTDAEQVARVAAGLAELAGVVVLVGGYAAPGLVHQSAPVDLDRMLRLNLWPVFLLARSTMPLLMAARGAFVAVGSRASVRPFAGAAGYVVSKAAVVSLIQALDVEYRSQGVRCNAVVPSVIDTAANRAQQPDADFSRWVPAEQIAAVIRFLVSPDSTAITGAAVPVYGRA
jgi:NAD(P)-dependent dehydrogenase (short-subunit alcohol dehydrogenase family)